jgi:diaminohydroxyphosphoribosylaminopyrimidine deaminase/5-amino-6-(5-phosphoribosylamino)uracil reductase
MTNIDSFYMQRCIELARMGAGKVAPNPLVGAVLLYKGRIIGEGYHHEYGQAHAEVNCINNVSEIDEKLIRSSTLYVSLEPCAHFGKTPPCSELIIHKGIRKVVIGCRDPFAQVNGKGIGQLEKAGIEVLTGILENECRELNKRFFTFVEKKRPYIIVKWAQTVNGKIADDLNERLLITNAYTNRLVHQWRSEEAAILIGTNTALLDNPSLTNRMWTGRSPLRMILDMSLRLPSDLKIFDQQQRTIVFNALKQEENGNILYYQINKEENIIQQITNAAHKLGVQSILVEGGARLLQSFISEGLWDEAYVITNEKLTTHNGLSGPLLDHHELQRTEKIASDTICYYTNKQINQ